MVIIVIEALAVAIPAAMVLLSDQIPYTWSIPTALAACALLPLRRRRPLVSLLFCLPALLGGLGWPPTVVALYRIGRTSSLRVIALSVTLTTVLPATLVVATQTLTLGAVLLTYSFTLFMSGAPAALGALITTRQDLTTSLEATKSARAAELEAREQSARASERARIAREIHDAVGHHATLIAVESAALAATTTDEATRETANRLRSLAKESLSEMRTALGLLNTDPPQTYASIPALVDRARAAGLTIRLDDRSTTPIPPSISRAAFRVIQEALTNVTKHAPGAPVQVRILDTDNTLTIKVTNGHPTTPAPNPSPGGGKGLVGLSERVSLVGGTLTTTRRDDGGFDLTATLPLTRPSKVDTDDSTFGGSARNPANA
ncbi:histidine kinase [Saccharothrix sp.]|uniref:sensor histidine kinase n=1 Tax=Saccharothrix sp. TaxID=1873460 RepID=UPI002811B7BD|nr:histidine kinase [Saccharothrix sp.]